MRIKPTLLQQINLDRFATRMGCSEAGTSPKISGKRFTLPVRLPDDILDSLSKRDVADPTCHDEIQKLAASLSIDYEDV